MEKNHRDLLYRSLDAKLAPGDEARLASALEKNADLREETKQALALRQQVSSAAAESFQPFFAGRVMARIQARENKSWANSFFGALTPVFRPAAIVGAVALLALVFLNREPLDYAALAESESVTAATMDDFVTETASQLLEDAL